MHIKTFNSFSFKKDVISDYVPCFQRLFKGKCGIYDLLLVGWTQWSAWGSCSLTCGTGVQGRSRTCQNPLASALNNSCAGGGNDFRTCSNNACKT